MFTRQNTFAPLPSLPPYHFNRPLAQREQPMSRHQHPTEYIYNLQHKAHERVPALMHRQHQRLDIVLEKNPRHSHLSWLDQLLFVRDGVLVGVDGLGRG